MNAKYLEVLEYNKIINFLNKYCKTYIGKENLSTLKPKFDKSSVSNLLFQTNEAVNLKIRKGSFPIDEIPDISLWITQLKGYSILSPKALLEITAILKVSRYLKEYFFTDENFDTSDFPILTHFFLSLYTNKGIEEKISSIILDDNTISDNASSTLLSIRNQIKKSEQEIRDKLNSFIHSNTYSKYIMEPIITIRNDRYVIPIKSEYKNTVKGLIHDISSSGSSVFIEPISVFDLNNKISSLKVEENIEIEKILKNLSDMLYDYCEPITNNLHIIGELDLIFAKANYSIDINGVLPIINDNKYVNFIKARHPLIPKEKIVPINISIGDKFTSLVITGPNTGGKTVTLKTFGLMLLMAYSGIFIPCSENSSIYIFDNIFADIGDEQSIQESLSTFSSHISNIVEITNTATSNSLILLDELGSGTDPIEGANLAISILQFFHNLGSIALSTTHYQELKNFCLLTDGFENASSEFDIDNLQPTYNLLIGIPGKSNAFAISRKLGLNTDILDTAKSLVNEDDTSIEELMKSIYDDKIQIEKEREEIHKNLVQIQTLRKSLENDKNSLKKRERELLDNAKNEARNIVLSAKEEANSIIKKLNKIEKSSSNNANNLTSANRLRNELNDKLQDINNSGDNKNTLNLEILKTLNTKNSMKNNTLDKQTSKGNISFNKNDKYKSKNISPEINVIGLNVDDALFVIDKYIDDCVIAKLSPIRIVHGKGTGKLRNGIHQYLKSNSSVKSFRLGTFGEGEMGVTVVELN